jgi:membrane protease YdiL (CAAX protease family)
MVSRYRSRQTVTSVITRSYALVLLIGLPLLAAREASLARGLDELRRAALYMSAVVSSLLLAGLTVGVAAWQHVPAAALGWRVDGLGRAGAWAGGMAFAGLALVASLTWLFARMGRTESPVLIALLPRTASERGAFVVLSIVAAVCEEYVFRGFILRTLGAWTGSAWLGAVLAAASFGLAHGYQRAGGVMRAAGLGVLLAAPVVVTGSLFPAIVAHFWINAVLGLGGWRWLLADHGEPG